MHCRKPIVLPHYRVWEEDARVSSMLCFCDKDCMVAYYTYRRKDEVASFTADEYGRLPVSTDSSEPEK